MAAKYDMLFLLVWRALRLRLQRVSVVFAALMVGATIVTALSAVWFDINTKMSEELRTFGANFYIGPGHGSGMPQEALQTILDQAPDGLVYGSSPWLYGMARTELEKVVMVGVWFESLQKLVPYWQVTGDWINVSFDDRNAMVGVKLAERLNVKPGDVITLVDHNARKKLVVKGIVESGDATDNMLIVSLDVAQAWLRQPGNISHGLLSVSNDVGQVERYAQRLQQQFPDLEVRPVRKVSASEGQVLDKIKGLMGLVSLVILALSSLCVNTTLMAIVSERSREFALQKALGSRNADIIRQMLLETGIIALAAVAAGWVLGYLLAQLLGLTVFNATISLRLPVLPITLILSLLVAALAAIVPVRRAVSVEPAKVLKGE
ncbi:ABC transporter permease [Superficieibacter electus]|uniref:ABC transporter permease n=1 Tax=Superficieibacter electus TaxID=2022662 RepID=A0A2P5GL29_9ENTR|nr:FtsX-like permease family protein [Superficieibacter electus]POP42648.1 ABC transporter permease [Superficieibacter electus]POP45724.1 ABC transporter permease [Superficieibacter electus]